MPVFTRGKARDNLVFVLINDFMYFGFKSKDLSSFAGISAADVAALGHLPADAAFLGKIRVLGANAPKPPKVSKKIENAIPGQQQSVSTYCGYDSLGDAQALNWKLTKSRQSVSLKVVNGFRGSLTAIATLSDGSLYCFPMNKADFDSFAAELGLKSAVDITTDSERKKLVSGSSIPFPGRASKTLDSNSSFSSFFSTDKLNDLAINNYSVLSEEKIIDSGTVPFLL